jgi:hypothetical protein
MMWYAASAGDRVNRRFGLGMSYVGNGDVTRRFEIFEQFCIDRC